jgi:thiosulfate/3-mercaptopyruvate sulfurtransferase
MEDGMSGYAHPEMLADTAWVAANLKNPKVRMVDVDALAFEQGDVPGALAWSWTTDLCDTIQRDILAKSQFKRLMAKSGIGNETTVILYGDNNNWFAAWALWEDSSST